MKVVFYFSSKNIKDNIFFVFLAKEFIEYKIHVIFRTDSAESFFSDLPDKHFEYFYSNLKLNESEVTFLNENKIDFLITNISSIIKEKEIPVINVNDYYKTDLSLRFLSYKNIIKEILIEVYGKENIYTIVDVGTNNVLNLIVRFYENSFKIIHRSVYSAALGKDMRNNILSEEAILRTKKILKKCIEFGKIFESKFIITGTSCSREANNISEIADWLKFNYKINYLIISEKDEAELNAKANYSEFNNLDSVLYFDIGGGSTEFTFVEKGEILWSKSLQLGLRRLQNKTELLEEQKKIIKNKLKDIKEKIRKNTTLVGIGGTVCSISAINKKLRFYDSSMVHKSCVEKKKVDQLLTQFKIMTEKEVSPFIPFDQTRVEIITTGIMVVYEIVEFWKKDYFVVSDYGIQFGIVNDLLKGKLNDYCF